MDKEKNKAVPEEIVEEIVEEEEVKTEEEAEAQKPEIEEQELPEEPEKTLEEIISEKEKEWQAEADRRVNQALAKKEKELEDKVNETLNERLKNVEVKEVEVEIKAAIQGYGVDLDQVKFIKSENYLGDNREKLAEDLESLKALLNTNKAPTIPKPPGIGRTYDSYEAARKTGNAEAMLKAKFGKK